jgi:hypothetical protein
MTDVGTGEGAVADGAATGDASGADCTTPPAQPPIDLQQLALFLASQQQFQQPPLPNHDVCPVSAAGSGYPFNMVGGQTFSTFGDASPFCSFVNAPAENLGGYGAVGSLGGRAAAGGLGFGVGGGHFSRGITSPADPLTVSRTVTFGSDPAGSDATRGVVLLRQLLDCIAALESRREPVDVSGGRPSSPTLSEASQASTPSTTSNNAAQLRLTTREQLIFWLTAGAQARRKVTVVSGSDLSIFALSLCHTFTGSPLAARFLQRLALSCSTSRTSAMKASCPRARSTST